VGRLAKSAIGFNLGMFPISLTYGFFTKNYEIVVALAGIVSIISCILIFIDFVYQNIKVTK
jgi:hypothetical protein